MFFYLTTLEIGLCISSSSIYSVLLACFVETTNCKCKENVFLFYLNKKVKLSGINNTFLKHGKITRLYNTNT